MRCQYLTCIAKGIKYGILNRSFYFNFITYLTVLHTNTLTHFSWCKSNGIIPIKKIDKTHIFWDDVIGEKRLKQKFGFLKSIEIEL